MDFQAVFCKKISCSFKSRFFTPPLSGKMFFKEYAKIEKEVMVIGAISRVEIWDSTKWENYNNDEDAMSLEEAAAKLSGMGI